MAFAVSDLVDMPRVTSVAWAPDGSWLAVAVQTVVDAAYVSQIWRVSLDGTPTLLVDGPGSHKAPGFRADGALGYLSNRDPASHDAPGDDARFQVWVNDGASETRVTDEPLGVSAFAFAERGERLIVVAPVLPGVPHEQQRAAAEDQRKHGPSALHYTSGTVRHWDHWLQPQAPHLIAYHADGTGRRDLTPMADRAHREASWALSPDGSRLVVTSARPSRLRIDEVALHVIDTATGATAVVFDRPCESAGEPCWSPDGSQIAFAHAVWSEDTPIRQHVHVVGADGTGLRALAPDWDRWGEPVGWSPDGSAVYVHADDAARHPLFSVDVATHAVERLPAAGGTHASMVCGPHGIAGVRHGLLSPPEAFVMPHGGEARTVSQLAGAFTPCGTVEEITTPGAGGDPVQSWVLLPEGEGPFPCLVWIHGGPMSAWGDQWHWRWNAQLALDHGYAVALPNPRGSTGFGQDFIDGIWHNQYGAACYEDVMAVTDAVAADPRIDGDRMMAMGGSFGGYMTNWIGGNTDRFKCLVTHASLYDLPRFYGVTDHPGFWLLKMGCTPWSDPEGFVRYSPHTKIPNWKSPTLVIHGEKDYRVPVGEGIALYEALQLHGVPSELLIFPDENHWILKPRNILAWYGHVFRFIGEHL